MTEEQKKNYARYWREREYRIELNKKHPDLGHVFAMRDGINSMQEELQEALDEHPHEHYFNGRFREDIETDIEILGEVFAHLDKESKELLAKYGVDKCES